MLDTVPARRQADDPVTRKGASMVPPGGALPLVGSAKSGAIPCPHSRPSSTMSRAASPLGLKSRAHPSSRRKRGLCSSRWAFISGDARAPVSPLSQQPGALGCEARLQPPIDNAITPTSQRHTSAVGTAVRSTRQRVVDGTRARLRNYWAAPSFWRATARQLASARLRAELTAWSAANSSSSVTMEPGAGKLGTMSSSSFKMV